MVFNFERAKNYTADYWPLPPVANREFMALAEIEGKRVACQKCRDVPKIVANTAIPCVPGAPEFFAHAPVFAQLHNTSAFLPRE
jgi:hypothetical protein